MITGIYDHVKCEKHHKAKKVNIMDPRLRKDAYKG